MKKRTIPPFAGVGEAPIHDLNTTPLIDVMLVLLIMFIVTIPVTTHKVPLDLPQGPPTTSERSEEHTSELQSLMRISYAVFCLKKKKLLNHTKNNNTYL